MSPEPATCERAASPPTLAGWVDRHQLYVWRFLRHLGCEANLAEDLTQEALIAALAEAIPDREPPTAQQWLRVTARNLYRMHLRQRRRRSDTRALADLEATFVAQTGDDLGASYFEALDQCLLGLDAKSREALRLRYSVEASREEMAAALGVSEEGVKSMLRRIRLRLRQCIEMRRSE